MNRFLKPALALLLISIDGAPQELSTNFVSIVSGQAEVKVQRHTERPHDLPSCEFISDIPEAAD